MAVGEIFLSAFLQVLFEKLVSPEAIEFLRREGLHTTIQKWKKKLETIRDVLDDAEEKQITEAGASIKRWLEKLEDLAYDVDDMLDVFATEALSRKQLNALYGGRSAILGEALMRAPNVNAYLGGFDGKLVFLRGYLASVGVQRDFVSKGYLSNMNYYLLANPRLRRFFSIEAPKKQNYENFYPKNKKEIPKGNEQKSESKEESNTDDHGNFQETFMKQFQNLLTPLLVIRLFLTSFSFGPREQQQRSTRSEP